MLCGQWPAHSIWTAPGSISRDLELVDVNLTQWRAIDPEGPWHEAGRAGSSIKLGTVTARPIARMVELVGAARQREALRELADDKHLLDDIGLTREQALDEATKPFWR
jgi:uncharacterized protein YjiS (DUF1127 family)